MPTPLRSLLSIPYDGSEVAAYLSIPEGVGRYPGIVLIEEIWGLTDHIKHVADRLAAEGFVVAAPELVPQSALQKLTRELNLTLFNPKTRNEAQPQLRDAMQPVTQPEFGPQAVRKLKACVDYLLADTQVSGKVGVVGFCFGGTYAFQLAAHDERLAAAVPFYGQPPELSSISSIRCPILNFNGAHDERIMTKLPDFATAMSDAGKAYENVVYPDAGHAFFNDTNPFAYRADDAKDAWQRALVFLHTHLA